VLVRRRAPIGRRRVHRRAKLGGRMPGPARVVEHRARQCDEISLAARDNVFGLAGAGDEPDGDRVDLSALPNAFGKKATDNRAPL